MIPFPIPPITPVEEHLNSVGPQDPPLLMDLLSLDTKYAIAFWFEIALLICGVLSLLEEHKFRRYLHFKQGWNETDPKIPMLAFDWYALRSSIAMVTHALNWLLYDAVGLKPTEVYAIAGIPFALIALHSILNDIPKDAHFTNKADFQTLLMNITVLFLLCIDSPYLLLAERINSILTFIAAQQLYWSPAAIAWIYQMPRHYAEEPVMVHHINLFGYWLLVMITLGGALVWHNPQVGDEDGREAMLTALGASLIVGIVGYAPILKDARVFVRNMSTGYIWMFTSFGVALSILVL